MTRKAIRFQPSGEGTRRALRTFFTALLVVALSLTLAACGGDADDEPRSEAVEAPEQSAEEETESESDETDSNDAQAFCDAVDAIPEDELSSDLQKAAGDIEGVQKAYKQFVAKYEEQLAAMVDAAPPEIKESAEAYVESYRLQAKGDYSAATKSNEKGTEAIEYYRFNCPQG